MGGIAIFAVDPGGKTGLAYGWFHDEAESCAAALKRARRKKSLHQFEIAGEPHHQAIVLAQMYYDFKYRSNVELGMRLEDIHIVMERFDIRQRNIDPASILVIGGFLTALAMPRDDRGIGQISKKTDETLTRIVCGPTGSVGDQPSFQHAGNAKQFATSARLRQWDAWSRGSDHARDATKHLALKLSDLLE